MDGPSPLSSEMPPAPAGAGVAALEEALSRAAPAFELPALVALLRSRFPERRLRFRSHPSLALEPTLVRAVAFVGAEIEITLNLGLRAVTTPLPSYFTEIFAHPLAGPSLEGVVALADHRLLGDHAEASAPVENERLVPRHASLRRSAFTLARPSSPITLGWLFRKVYPELEVSVRRAGHERRLPAPDARIGQATLGISALGGEAEVSVPGVDAILVTDASRTWADEPWTREARARLFARVLPALSGAAVHLRVLLVDHEASGKLVVRGPGELGWDPLAKSRPSEVHTLFEGRPPDRSM
ncbi:hypothetical protein [Polyangium spumosum]|uniref:Type VI secretion system baseplate subunit TssG n=1 Tax=Polyangium spumosum TaxID=889282 RepID=A0A6N7PR39_9BACT|nr:hypothetical protein [Polyangium spumosum]MRG92584.1 hypothetical protein [Polyangium spumosum]